jgi:hypothetical protein
MVENEAYKREIHPGGKINRIVSKRDEFISKTCLFRQRGNNSKQSEGGYEFLIHVKLAKRPYLMIGPDNELQFLFSV